MNWKHRVMDLFSEMEKIAVTTGSMSQKGKELSNECNNLFYNAYLKGEYKGKLMAPHLYSVDPYKQKQKKEITMTNSQLAKALSLASEELASFLYCPKNFKKPEDEPCFGGCSVCIEKHFEEKSKNE